MLPVISFLILSKTETRFGVFNLIPHISQGPKKTQMAYLNLSNSGMFSYKGVGRVVATTRLVSKLVNQTLCLNPIQADTSPKALRTQVRRVLLDQMLSTLRLSQILLFLLKNFIPFLGTFPVLD